MLISELENRLKNHREEYGDSEAIFCNAYSDEQNPCGNYKFWADCHIAKQKAVNDSDCVIFVCGEFKLNADK